MKTNLLTLCIVGALCTFLSSCKINVMKGEGPKGTATPAVASFNAIDIDLSIKANINVQAGAQPGVQLNGYENLLKHIKATVKDNTLHITSDLDEMWTISGNDVVAEITLPSLNALSLSGAPDADIHGNITGNTFNLDISGSSKVVIDNINVDTFASDASGVARITVNGGAVRKATYELSGAGTINAFPLQADETEASISGTGKSEVTALKKLDASISGAGSIKYKGHPSVSQDVSGVGSISDAN